ncbi:thioredoxin-like protein [Limtongia smithiae]|uniref:thioredoxin-like protein n=1 Tax=Limtongia smithiae TaxID=1125753 RepID=UPI0034CEB375
MSSVRGLFAATKWRSLAAGATLRSPFLNGAATSLPFLVMRGQQARFMSEQTREAIDSAAKSSPVVLFMKGTPEQPQCGFSRATIQILGLEGVDPEKFAAYNVLESPQLREGIKEYSDWPTIPQLYVKGEFVGGCDIVMAMHQSGELSELLHKADAVAEEEDIESPEEAKKTDDKTSGQ